MPPNHFESEVESFLEGSHGDRTHIKRADHHTVTPLCGTLLLLRVGARTGEQLRGRTQRIDDRGGHHGTRHGNSNQSGEPSVSGARVRAGCGRQTSAACTWRRLFLIFLIEPASGISCAYIHTPATVPSLPISQPPPACAGCTAVHTPDLPRHSASTQPPSAPPQTPAVPVARLSDVTI